MTTRPNALQRTRPSRSGCNPRVPQAGLLGLALMSVRFANSYIDRLFAEKDLDGLHHLISAVGRDRPLPQQFWLFCRVLEWAPARSGVWQYYDGLSEEKFERMSQALERFGLGDLAEKYRLGKT